jgi:hypothetical protein
MDQETNEGNSGGNNTLPDDQSSVDKNAAMTAAAYFPVYYFLFCVAFSVKFTIQIPLSLCRVEISSLFRVEVLPMLMVRTSAKRPHFRSHVF